MAVGGVFVLIAVAFVAATGGFFVGVMQRNRRRTRGFLVGFCCGWLTGAVLRGRRRGLRAVTALVRR